MSGTRGSCVSVDPDPAGHYSLVRGGRLQTNLVNLEKHGDDLEASVLIAEVRRAFIASLSGLIEALEDACSGANPAEPATLAVALELAHRLAGSGGTFGMDGLSRAARKLEQFLAASEVGDGWRRELLRHLNQVVDSTHSPSEMLEIPRSTPSRAPISSPYAAEAATSSRYPHPYGRWAAVPVVIIVDGLHTRQAIQAALHQFGFLVVVADTPARFPITPLAFICTLDHATRLRQLHPKGEIIIVLDYSDLEARISAVRLGCRATISTDADAPDVAAAMERIVPLELEVPRVLIVDDDEFVSRVTAGVLQKRGLEATVLTDPHSLLEVTASVRPHLVVMDMRLPGCTGLELAAVLRHDDRMVGVPIVFLTAEDEPARAIQALEVGADDFLAKPVDPEKLIAVVCSRLERSRILRSYMDRDSLTRLLSHARTLERLEAEVQATDRHREPLSLAILDLDNFKHVNDQYGHATGDRVLRSLSTVLRRRSRRSDIVGRCGGEEFVLILPGTRGSDAWNLVNERREAFASLQYATHKGQISVTFSAGVAELLPGEVPASLWDRADTALYAAKRSGKNYVALAEPAPLRPTP